MNAVSILRSKSNASRREITYAAVNVGAAPFVLLYAHLFEFTFVASALLCYWLAVAMILRINFVASPRFIAFGRGVLRLIFGKRIASRIDAITADLEQRGLVPKGLGPSAGDVLAVIFGGKFAARRELALQRMNERERIAKELGIPVVEVMEREHAASNIK